VIHIASWQCGCGLTCKILSGGFRMWWWFMLPHLYNYRYVHPQFVVSLVTNHLTCLGSLTAWAYSHGSNSPHMCVYIYIYTIVYCMWCPIWQLLSLRWSRSWCWSGHMTQHGCVKRKGSQLCKYMWEMFPIILATGFECRVVLGVCCNAQKVVQFGSIGETVPFSTLDFLEICFKLL